MLVSQMLAPDGADLLHSLRIHNWMAAESYGDEWQLRYGARVEALTLPIFPATVVAGRNDVFAQCAETVLRDGVVASPVEGAGSDPSFTSNPAQAGPFKTNSPGIVSASGEPLTKLPFYIKAGGQFTGTGGRVGGCDGSGSVPFFIQFDANNNAYVELEAVSNCVLEQSQRIGNLDTKVAEIATAVKSSKAPPRKPNPRYTPGTGPGVIPYARPAYRPPAYGHHPPNHQQGFHGAPQ
jgi:hypothetical protein